MSARLAQIGLRRGKILARRIHGGFRRLQRRHHFVARLLAHDSLLRQSHGAAGIRLLMFVLRLSLRQRGFGRLHLCFGAHHCARGFALVLPLRVFAAIQLPVLAGRGGLGSLQRGFQILALDRRDQLALGHVLAFFHR